MQKITSFKTLYDGKRNRIQTTFKDDVKVVGGVKYGDFDRTKQQFKDECDINNIIAKYPDLSISNAIVNNPELYGEYDTSMDYMQAFDIVANAQEQFDSLPVQLRKRFDYNPAEFLSFLENPANRDEAQKLGLLKEKITVPLPAQPVEQPVIQTPIESVTPANTESAPMP